MRYLFFLGKASCLAAIKTRGLANKKKFGTGKELRRGYNFQERKSIRKPSKK